MKEESDYIKRSIELYKYLFSSSAALLLIMTWKLFTEIKVLTSIQGILIMVFTLCAGFLCVYAIKKWTNLVEELNK